MGISRYGFNDVGRAATLRLLPLPAEREHGGHHDEEHRNVLNPDGLRSQDEFAKHKLLDAMGDLYVLGHPLVAHYRAFKSGHEINNKLLRALLANPENWEFVEYQDEPTAPKAFTEAVKEPSN